MSREKWNDVVFRKQPEVTRGLFSVDARLIPRAPPKWVSRGRSRRPFPTARSLSFPVTSTLERLARPTTTGVSE